MSTSFSNVRFNNCSPNLDVGFVKLQSDCFGVVSDEHYEIFHEEIFANGETISEQAEHHHVSCQRWILTNDALATK
jgi:hypothetical protein